MYAYRYIYMCVCVFMYVCIYVCKEGAKLANVVEWKNRDYR